MSWMRIALQRVLLSTYERANRAGLLDTRAFAQVFQRSYFAYKRLVEDPFARLVKAHPALVAGGDVVDVGANIGYTAAVFARALRPPHRVHAFEPEARNFRWLEQSIARARLLDRVVAHRAAVGARDGTIEIWPNPGHHGDHRVATPQLARGGPTQEVPIVAIDSYLAKLGWPPIAFVKIDVQGFEPEVLAGLRETIAKNSRIAVAVEIMPSAIAELGFAAGRFIEDLARALPSLAILERDGTLHAISADAVLATAERADLGYVDVICMRP